MLNGLSGSLLSHYFAERLLAVEFPGELGETSVAQAFVGFVHWWRDHASQLGPASSHRSITDRAVLPLLEFLGFRVAGEFVTHHEARVSIAVGLWSESLDTLWRRGVRAGLATSSPWCFCSNGRELRLVDATHTYSRAYLQFDLERVADDPRAFAVFWGLFRADAFLPRRDGLPLIRRAIQESARHGARVGRSLRSGVIDSVATLLTGLLAAKLRKGQPGDREIGAGFDESLTLVYRVLFLMFAEAHGLVPIWHPIYRDHYTIESLREAVARPGATPGLWEALQAISRLAHRGCRAGTLGVPAFNGRLFSPARSPLAETTKVSDALVQRALIALSTASTHSDHRVRIDYRDLGVEQLGAVYETVLDYEPAVTESDSEGRRIVLRRGGGQRKVTGSFYTPQSITDYLVRRTLHPLAAYATPTQILHLRVVDPSMGSAAFLVSACRYLAGAYERALIREGACQENDISDEDRAGFRRTIAQRCLFGVDLNPTAVQLARLSLWLATLASDKPLSFLDHHLVCGDSLVGASPIDLARQAPPGARRRASLSRNVDTPLFSDADLEPLLAATVRERCWITNVPDDTPAVVREKERRLERLDGTTRWKALADFWCACWMWPTDSDSPSAAVFASLREQILTGRATLPPHLAEPLLLQAQAVAAGNRFLHWMLEFPEIWFDADGQPVDNPGFDAVIGNPPWNVVAGESAEKSFIRGSGVYRYQGRGHINRYQLFVERALGLIKRGGRIGMVLPSGFATDHTSSALRRRILEHCDLDSLAGFDNRRAIFPIHRSVRFVVFTATSGRATASIRCRFGIDDPNVLDAVPDDGDRPVDATHSVTITRDVIERVSGEPRTIPEFHAPLDLAIVERIARRFPRLGDADGWGAQFGRELNATDDKAHFRRRGRGLSVLEGKHIEPFVTHVDQTILTIAEKRARQLIDPARSFMRARLAYRDVASSTNRVSLIAAVLPQGVLTTHSLFCLKTALTEDEQHYLCGMLNSFVANYLVRQVMTTHLGSTTVERLRVPRPTHESWEFETISAHARELSRGGSLEAAARLQAAAARAYGLTLEELTHVLASFPLVGETEKTAVLELFSWDR